MRCRILIAIGSRPAISGGDHLEAYERAAEIAERHNWAEVVAEAALTGATWTAYGWVDERMVALLERGLAALPETDGSQRVQLLGAIAGILALDGRDPSRRETLSGEAIAMARRLGDPTVLAHALRSRSAALPGPDRIADRLAAVNELLELRPRIEPRLTYLARVRRSGLRMVRGDISGARHDVEALAADVAVTKDAYYEGEVDRLRGTLAFIDGDLSAAERLARASAAMSERLFDLDGPVLLLANLLPIRLEQDRATDLLAGHRNAHRRAGIRPMARRRGPAADRGRAARRRVDGASGLDR